MTQEQIDIKALDLLEQQMSEEQELSAEGVPSLSAEEQHALDEDVLTLQSLRTVLRREQQPVDVEARLAAFHAGHRAPRRRRLAVVSAAILAAAAVTILLFVLRPTAPTAPTPTQPALSRGTVFVAQKASRVTIADGHDQAVAVNDESSDVIITADMLRYLDRHTVDRVVTVPYGNSATIILPDGSTAYVRAGSTINFYTHPINGRRIVKLDGQAYFCVRHDAEHPFVVTDLHDQTHITDIGTEFNVDTRTPHGIAVTLIDGCVDVAHVGSNGKETAAIGSKSTRLAPGQQALVVASGITTREVDTTPYTNWRDGFFYYDNMPLADILEDIGKNYNLTVHFRNLDAMHFRTHFVADRTQGIAPVLDLLNRMGKVKAHLNGSTIVLE